METELKCLKCAKEVSNSLLCDECVDNDLQQAQITGIERICMCDGFRGTAEAMQIAKIRCGCDKCKSGDIMQSQEVIDHKYTAKTNGTNQVCTECEEEAVTFIDGVCNVCTSLKDEDDFINYPKHYNTCKIQPIDVIEDWKLDFRLANSVKYIQRHLHKGSAKKDLEKAIWYIQRYIDKELDKEVK